MAGVPERQKDGGSSDFDGDGDSLGIEVIPADSEAKGGVDPSCSEMRESSGDGSEACHLPDGTKRRVGHGSDWATRR